MMNDNLELKFKGGNPGAVRHGNFINYYEFNPAENRIKLFPKNIWVIPNDTYCCLDIGCNSGELTRSLLQFFQEHVNQNGEYQFIGIDVDPVLIECAQKLEKSKGLIEYKCVDFMNDGQRDLLSGYLQKFNKINFNVTFVLSVTMWIHLNYGDSGLRRFLRSVCDISEMVVVEPQPWKCYRAAMKRLQEVDSEFPLFKYLKYRQNVVSVIEKILEECKFIKVAETPLTNWGRKILFYKRIEK